MKYLIVFVGYIAFFLPVLSQAATIDDSIVAEMAAHDVILLGEVHDNPIHHDRQQAFVAALHPKAIVWEMLTQKQAAMVSDALIANRAALEQTLDWAASNWPAFEMYYPIFEAAPDAKTFGGHVPRAEARAAFQEGVLVVFGAEFARYGLDAALPDEEQSNREAGQLAAHCDALPEDLLPKMVAIQRLRDATLARAVVAAYTETGGPVVVITGSGHVRKDWGVPSYLARVAPEIRVFALGQSEAGQSVGEFDLVLDSPAVEREDPCAAFKSKE